MAIHLMNPVNRQYVTTANLVGQRGLIGHQCNNLLIIVLIMFLFAKQYCGNFSCHAAGRRG